MVVGSIGFKSVSGAGHKSLAPTDGALALVGHANGWVHIGAQTAKDALGQIELSNTLAIRVLKGNRAGWANVGGRARVFPVSPIDLRPAASTRRNLGRGFRIGSGDEADVKALAKSLEHG